MRKPVVVVGYLAISISTLSADPALGEIRTGQQTSPNRVEGWPQWRGPARDGVASTFTAPGAWPAQLTRRWQATVGASHASPIVAGNRVSVHTRQAHREIVAAYDLASGNQLWQDGVWAGVYLAGPRDLCRIERDRVSQGKWTATPAWRNEQISMYMSSPAASGNSVFGLSHRNRGQLFALDAATGKTLWVGKGREAENASIVRAGDLLLLATTNSELIVAKASAPAFEEVKRYTIADSAMWAHPAFVGRNIVVKDVDKLIVWSF